MSIEFFRGLAETRDIVEKLWPDDFGRFGTMTASEARQFLNEKTGLDIPGTAPATFEHWLPKLREMVK